MLNLRSNPGNGTARGSKPKLNATPVNGDEWKEWGRKPRVHGVANVAAALHLAEAADLADEIVARVYDCPLQ